MKQIVQKLKSALGFSKGIAAQPLPFDLLFKYFREVLDSKNRAIETIADMGEKLGGDYLFDITYIRNTYEKLYTEMKDSIRIFDDLTRSKFSPLSEVFARIDTQIRLMVDGISPSGDERILFYPDITWDMSRFVGGKNTGLAELKNSIRMNVPEGFAITTKAFDEFISYNNLGEQIQAIGDDPISEQSLSALQNSILRAGIPLALSIDIRKALAKLLEKSLDKVFLAIRSSAEDEDSDYSFAGQFETLLNIPADHTEVQEAYKKVVASLYSPKSAAYHKKTGYDLRSARMAVACLVMVDALASGVAYSSDPSPGGADTVVINSTWGLGKSVVEGQIDADFYLVKKEPELSLAEKKTGNKTSIVARDSVRGTITFKLPDDMREKSSLTDDQVLDITGQAIRIEKYFRKPVDIEWAIEKNGTVVILQARPLRLIKKEESKVKVIGKEIAGLEPLRMLLHNTGTVVQRGVGAGRVFIIKHMGELDNFPKGAILVARNDSSEFIRALPYASAIITDLGTPTSHMSSVCREFRVPAIVNTGIATQVFSQGQEITVSIEDEENSQVYEGIIRDLAAWTDTYSTRMDELFELRKERYILRHITPLNLIDPLMDNFTPEKCRTMHDILRFIHEKSVTELVDKARYGNNMINKQAAIKLDIPVPLGIVIIDIGGGLNIDRKSKQASLDQITSIALLEIIRGMTYPGIWRSEASSLGVTDFLSSMMRMSDITSDTNDHVVYNVALASKEYVNLSLRLGYHFNMIDCYYSENTKNNHIYFRFVGGATDMTKRSRRVQLLSDILREFGFNITIKGDLIIGRLANIQKDDMRKILNQMGRLIAYTRQLDARLHDDTAIEKYKNNFMEGNYGL